MPGDEISAILQALERFNGIYQREAVDAAIAQREEITPHLIVSLEKVAADPSVYLEDEGYYLHIYAFMLLGYFQETRAHQAIVEVFGLPGDIPMNFSATSPLEICPLFSSIPAAAILI